VYRTPTNFAIATTALLLICVPAFLGQPSQLRAATPDQPTTTASIPNGKYYALVIGINAYPAPLPSLKTAENDAQAIAKTLEDDYGFQTKLLLGPAATRNNILAAVNQYETTLQANDNLLIYYAGHGYENKTTGKAYWLPADADSTSNPNRIIADDITSEMAAIPARHVLVISDSCYSGGLSRDADVIPQSHGQEAFLQKMLNGRSRTLMASGGDEPVTDNGKGGHSAFANAVLQALINTRQALFTASDLFYDGAGGVQRRVAGGSEQIPQYAIIRNSGHDEGDFVFTRKNATTAEIAAKLAALGPAYNRGAALFESKHYFAALPLLASACDAKSYRACSYLGLMYEDGHGVPTNIVRAIGLFSQACDNGDGKGCNDLAILYDHGTGLPKDLPRAAELWAKACSGNYAISCSSLGAMYAFSDPPHDYARAAELFSKNCDEVSQLGCRGQGVIYEEGLGTARDDAKAQLFYRKGCDFGDGQSCIKVGIHAITRSPPDYQVASYAYRRACDLAVASGCELGFMELQGQGVAKDEIEAAALYGQACDTDPASGCESLGHAYENGWGFSVDYVQAAFIFRVGCDADDGNACRNLGKLYETGQGVSQDYPQAVTLYRKGCDGQDADSCSNLAAMYEKGTGVAPDVTQAQDQAQAVALYRKACEGGSFNGCTNLGAMYVDGTGVAQDLAQAISLYRKACEGGSALGCSNLGGMYNNGTGVAQDQAQAVALYRKGCDGGDVNGCTNLGTMYANGTSLAQDKTLAVALYRKACDGDDAPGCVGLGVMYKNGTGIAQDKTLAVALFRKACDGGEPSGCSNLGVMYNLGAGVTQDYTLAVTFFSKGCDGGYANGCTNLGFMYENGTGVAKDKTLAAALFRKACDGGDTDGCTNLKRLQP